MKPLCPICGAELNREPYEDGVGSNCACPCCDFKYGVTDEIEGYSFERYRRRWVESGARWSLIGNPPSGWDASLQLQRIGIDLNALRNSLLLLSERAASSIAEELLCESDHVENVWPQDVLAALETINSHELAQFYPYYWINAINVNTGNGDSLVVVHGISPDGVRQIIGVEAILRESTRSWQAMFERLRERGMTSRPLVNSENVLPLREGLRAACPDAVWQWRTSNFIATVVSSIKTPPERSQVRRLLWNIFNAETVPEARAEIALSRPLICRSHAACTIFENGLDSATTYFMYPEMLHVFTHPGIHFAFWWFEQRLKRFHEMPHVTSLLRLLAAMAVEQNDWYRERHDVVIK